MKKLKDKKVYNLLFCVLLLIILFRPVILLHKGIGESFSKGYGGKYEHLKSQYYSSQYVQKKNPNIMHDGALEAFAGGVFLNGINPILIVHDQPPLGRYLTSLSILIFDNEAAIAVLLLILSTFGIFLIGRRIFKNSLIALIPLGIFINEPLFLNKFNYLPILEPIQLPFIIFALYCFIKAVFEKNYKIWFLLTSVFIGFVISTRFFILGFFLLMAMFSYLFLQKSLKKIIFFSLTLPVSLAILLLSYFKTIQNGYSLIQIFGIQKYIFFYHKSQLSMPFSFWDLLLFNRWHTWWGTNAISFDSEWVFIWPIATVLTGLLLFSSLFKIKKIFLHKPEKILLLWIIFYTLLLSFGQTSTRYFLPLNPFLYILATSFIIKIIKK